MNSKPPAAGIAEQQNHCAVGLRFAENQQANWWCPDHDVYEYYAQLKAKVAAGEIEVISIDPVVTSTHEYLGREHVKHIALTRKLTCRCNWRWHIRCTVKTCTTKTSLLTTVWVLSSSCRICWVRKTVSRKMPHGLKTDRH